MLYTYTQDQSEVSVCLSVQGRSLLRSQSYCMPPVVGDGKTAPSLSGELIGDESMVCMRNSMQLSDIMQLCI